jgi:hypothetical protein
MAAPGLVSAPVTLAALDQATKLGPAAARAAELAPARETQLVLAPVVAATEVAGPVLVLATLLERAPVINPAPVEMVGTKSRFGGG